VRDPRLEKLAKVLVHYSLRIQPGQLVRITGIAAAGPLIQEAYREALAAGAHVFTRVSLDGLDEIFYKQATEAQLRFVSPLARHEVEAIDADLSIWGSWNTRALTGVDPQRMALRREATRELTRRFLERAAAGALRWVGTQYPTLADAQEAEMSLAEYEEFVFTAGMLDRPDPVAAWEAVRREQERVIRMLETKDTLHVRGPHVDLTVRVGGRKWINAAGEHNFPDGEIFTGPVEDATEGWVRFSFPAVYGGREVQGVRLRFAGGRVVEAEAEKGQEFLRAMLDLDAGARTVGEFAFGLNYRITRFTRSILFDEKIGGTMHLALGAGYPETGSRNTSGLHWDMICDLRADTEVRADGEVIYRDGRFLL
jgi:aminopeptidase